ncbi:MAG: 16S rRNA (cytosine(1402)-N(4))-methyltransferase RsmH [Brevinema sp.]
MTIYHTPILVDTIINYFSLSSTSIIADLTTGEGGHASLLAKYNPEGQMLCLDRDRIILEKARDRMKEFTHITYVCDTYDHLTTIRKQQHFPLFDAILIDMGISMFHFKGAGRGFSFDDDTLDMRLSEEGILSAEQVINTFSEQDLADIFYYYGEERFSRRFAREIVRQRPFFSAKELADFLLTSIGRHGKIHPATKIFQALRIFINEELEIVENMLKDIIFNLAINGIFCVLTFHSLEDRLVKNSFKEYARAGLGTILTPKPMTPSREEIAQNPAARSAKLRVFKRREDAGI